MNPEKLEKLRHKNRMREIEKEIQGKIEVEKLKFNFALQVQRIKSAEIRRSIERKSNRDFIQDSYKK